MTSLAHASRYTLGSGSQKSALTLVFCAVAMLVTPLAQGQSCKSDGLQVFPQNRRDSNPRIFAPWMAVALLSLYIWPVHEARFVRQSAASIGSTT